MVAEEDGESVKVALTPRRSHSVLYLAFRMIGFAAVFAVAGILVWGIQVMRRANRRNFTRTCFMQVASSLSDYSEVFGHLPYPARRESGGQSIETGSRNGTGYPLYSWRVEIVPFLQGWHGSWDKSQSWKNPVNSELSELSLFYAYGPTKQQSEVSDKAFPDTNALAITGPGTAFGDGKEPPKALKDVPANAILVVEVRSSGIPWPSPGDFDIRDMPGTINPSNGKGISSVHSGGFHVIFADGVVRFLSDKVPFETLRKFFTIADAKKFDRENLLGPYVLEHTGDAFRFSLPN